MAYTIQKQHGSLYVRTIKSTLRYRNILLTKHYNAMSKTDSFVISNALSMIQR